MYSAGMLHEWVTVCPPLTVESDYGGGRVSYPESSRFNVFAGVSWQRGSQALARGDIMLMDTIMVRVRNAHPSLTPRCRLIWNDQYYQITSFNRDKKEGTIQITANQVEHLEG